jgi:hypothetical protein
MWAWVAQTVEGQMIGDLIEARGRKVTFDLRGPASATFEIDGLSDVGLDLTELTTDLMCWRDDELLFRGRLGSTDDNLNADRHTTSWAAVDYRALLGARINQTDYNYAGWSQADIGWDQIVTAQNLGPGWGITRGDARAAGHARNLYVEANTPISTVLDLFEDMENGFEWWIDPELRFQQATWRGVERTFPVAWGTTATRIKRSYDTSRYANWVRVKGGRPEGAGQDDPEPQADRWAPDLATRREGRIARFVSNSDLKEQGVVNAAADQLLADSLNVPAAYAASLIPGAWDGPRDLWLGDTTPIIVRSGRLDVATTGRIFQISVAIDDDGAEEVELVFGHD